MEGKEFFLKKTFPNRIEGKELTNIWDHIAHIACIAKVSNPKQLKILTPKQMLQKLALAFAQVKAGNKSENLLNEIRQIIYSLYWAKEITKKIYKNIMNSINL